MQAFLPAPFCLQHHPSIHFYHACHAHNTGVTLLELLLGTPAVLAPSQSARAALSRSPRLARASPADAAALLALRGLMELCIWPPSVRQLEGRQLKSHNAHRQISIPGDDDLFATPRGGGWGVRFSPFENNTRFKMTSLLHVCHHCFSFTPTDLPPH